MDFPQVEEQFKALKEQFTAGKLDEAAFKAQLNELMVQDGQGRWWMIGYETGQWYMHDGTAWVRADPPARAPAKPSIPPPEPIKIQAEPGPAVQPAAPAAELLAGKPEEPQAVQAEIRPPGAQAVKMPAGFVPNRAREALLVLLGGAVYGGVLFVQNQLITALTLPIPLITGIFFGPWVGGLTGALGGLIIAIFYSMKGMDPSGIPGFVVYNCIAGFIPALLVKDARNWKSVLFACLLVGVPDLIGLFIRSVSNFGESYFWSGILDNLLYTQVPILLLTPLLARELIDAVRERGWYWRDTAEPRKVTLTNWKTIFTLATTWGVLWVLTFGLGININDTWETLFMYSIPCGLLSGLAALLILRSTFPALRWGQALLILAGWGIGFFAATDAFARVVVYGYTQTEYFVDLLVLGGAGGIGMGVALKWAGVFTQWRQALVSAAVWTGGIVVLAFISAILLQITVDRLFVTGLLVGAVGAWGIFWQSRPAAPGGGEQPINPAGV